jgi:hypothetical protein
MACTTPPMGYLDTMSHGMRNGHRLRERIALWSVKERERLSLQELLSIEKWTREHQVLSTKGQTREHQVP